MQRLDVCINSAKAIQVPIGYAGAVAVETEIKIRVQSTAPMRRRLRRLGFEIHARRAFESNAVFDTPDRRLRRNGELIRVRRVSRDGVLTYKGAGKSGRHKSREEIETRLSDPGAVEQILQRLGLRQTFRYDKYRTEYSRPQKPGIVTVDETPIGNFMELEGTPAWIDRTARELGFSTAEYITKSYATLYSEYCRERGFTPSNMVFSGATDGTPAKSAAS